MVSTVVLACLMVVVGTCMQLLLSLPDVQLTLLSEVRQSGWCAM
jgi:hypothetical protein